jgi:hypothetical protein
MTAHTDLDTCALCGAAEPFGQALCPGCGGTSPVVGDTLVFVQTAGAGADSHMVAQSLDGLLAGRAHLSERGLVAAGHRALLRVPAAGADAAVARLAKLGIPAEARPAIGTWASAPESFYLLLATVVLVGMTAGLRAEPMLRWMSPLYAALLLLASQVRLRLPAVRGSRRVAFPLPVERALAEAFARLPDGTARDLLVRLVNAATPLQRALRRQHAAARRRDVEDLLIAACRAGEDLADLEHGVATLGDGPGADRVRGLHDGLLNRFRDGIAALHKLRAESIADDPVQEELARLVASLDEDVEAYTAARRELATLLK